MGAQADEMTRVLIVDDDEDIRHTLRLLLEDEGYGVAEAIDGEEGYRRLASEQTPHVVLLDVLMPKLTGFEILQRLDAHLPHRFVLLTALHRPFSAAEDALLRQWGAILLRKPFDISVALAVVQNAVKQLPPA